MSLIVSCSRCDKNYKVGDDKAGKKIKCGGCGAIIPIPAGTEDEADPWDTSSAPSDDEPSLPPRRTGTRQVEPSRASRSSKRSSGGMPTWFKVLLISLGALGGMTMLGVAGWFVVPLITQKANQPASPSASPQASSFPQATPWEFTPPTPSTPAPASPPAAMNFTWTKYADSEAGFEIEFPEKNVEINLIPVGKKYEVQISGTQVTFEVQYMMFQRKPLTSENLKRVSDDTIAHFQGQLITRKDISAAGCPGIQTEYTRVAFGKTVLHTTREILTNDRVYMFEVARLKDSGLTQETDRFFNSFHLLKQ